ncbi:glycoside hydrolase/deacetylase, partial [Rhizopus microsporus ATCC 52813]
LEGFPTTWAIPPTDSDEVQTIYNSINWNKVPSAPVRKIKSDGSFSPNSDGSSDPYCYWSDTNCVKPKASYLPPDLYECPKKGDWGLTYDDGPFNKPALYNFLGRKNLHASLFYIGSSVVNYPAAARLALNNGHSLCVHTWSHNPMTTLTNAEIVAELYWGIKAIKTATGVTPKCWRPPQGDVDDRVRSIAWQMGMRTVLWNEDTNDWDMPDPMNGGNLPPKTVDGYFQSWINAQKAGTLKTGILVLEHELNHMTVNMSMYWLPKLQSTFNVVSALECNGISQPYWETNFVYP